MLTHAADGKCSVPDVARWMCEGPAQVYGMEGKGRLLEGFDADLVLVDMESRRSITDSDTWSRVGWTSYQGIPLTGWPVSTFVEGRLVFRRAPEGPARGEVSVDGGSAGRPLRFSPSR